MNGVMAFRGWPLSGREPAGFDWTLLLTVAALVSIGAVMVGSASITFADHTYHDGFHFLKRHLVYLAVGACAGVLVLQVPMAFWCRHGTLILLGVVVLLVLVLIPGIGRQVNGSRRWIGYGPLTLQVSEVAKLAMIIFIAGYLHRHQEQLRRQWQGFTKPVVILGLIVALLMLEPDFGSSAVIAGTVLTMLFLAGVRLWQFCLLLLAGAGGLGVLALTSPYRVQRLITYLDPWADQYNTGYQLTQSLIAFGRGQWFGVGLGNSVQKLFYLPEAHTDFVFAIFAEEFGLLGVALVLGLFVILVTRIFRVARRAVGRQDWFTAYTLFGIGILLAGQAFINIGVTSGLLPTKGLTLPFISYGGSSLLVCCVMVALVLRAGMELEDLAPMAGQVKHGRAGE